MKSGPDILKTDALHPDPDSIEAACRIIQSGGVVVFPASSLYGLAADAFNPSAVEKIRRMKKRPASNPILVLVRNRKALAALAAHVSPEAEVLISVFWPGSVTLVFSARETVPAHLTSGSGKIGIRVPAHPVARALVRQLDSAITGTSANISGQPGVDTAAGIIEMLAEPPDLVLDAGRLKGGAGSTVVDVSVSPPRVLREGAVRAQEVLAALN